MRNAGRVGRLNTLSQMPLVRISFLQLKVYATMYEELERWDGTNIGYTWTVRYTSTALLPITVILSTPIAAVVFVVLFSALRGIVDESPSLEFLYGLEIPALIITFVEFVTSIILWVDCSTFSCVVKASTPIAIFIFGVCFEVHLLIHGLVNVKRLSNCKWYVKLSYLCELFFLNFVFFKALLALVSISFIPLILLIIVYPAEILCTILIYFAVIILFTLLLSPLTYIIACKAKDVTDKIKKIEKKGYWQIIWNRQKERSRRQSTRLSY